MTRIPVLAQFRLVLEHDLRRLAAGVRRPRPGVWLSVLLPLLLVGSALAAAGPDALPEAREAGGAVGLGFLVSAPSAFFAYGILFRPRDDAFLRRLGVAPVALYLERALRLLLVVFGVAALLLVPFVVAGAGVTRPASILFAAGAAAWGAALLALARAADQTARPGHRPGLFSRLLAQDRELVRVGPLVYAPLAPLAAALAAAGWVGAAAGSGWARAGLVVAAGLGLAAAAARPFARALPRFAPRALEMAFAPPPAAGEAGLVLDRGLARLLPRRSRAVLARDAAVTARRFRWSTSIVWPVVLISAVALARWGAIPQVRSWVLAAGALTLAAQGAGLIALGQLERAGPRWLDRAAGLRLLDRWTGRWALGFGLALWLVVPLAIAWGVWAGTWPGWYWLLGAAITAGVAASASLAAAGR